MSLLLLYKRDFRYQTCVYNGSHDLLKKKLGFDAAAVVTDGKVITESIFAIWVKLKP